MKFCVDMFEKPPLESIKNLLAIFIGLLQYIGIRSFTGNGRAAIQTVGLFVNSSRPDGPVVSTRTNQSQRVNESSAPPSHSAVRILVFLLLAEDDAEARRRRRGSGLAGGDVMNVPASGRNALAEVRGKYEATHN